VHLAGRQGASKPIDCDALYRNYGAAIARMHLALATFSDAALAHRAQREALIPTVFDYGLSYIVGHLTGAQAGTFQAMMADIGAEMRVAFQDLPEQLLHRDCHAGNLLSCEAEITGIIDWDHLRIGARIFDLAYFAAQLGKRHVGDPETMAQWLHDVLLVLERYDQENRLSAGEEAAFPYAVIAVLIAFAGWMIEVDWIEALQTELDAMAWMHSHLRIVQERVAAVLGDPDH
jgi:Ser/Thr protein kinase RdoA (MazF antagonist)